MKYTLIKEENGGEFPYLDQNGVSNRTPQEWLFGGILGGCGCGSSEHLAQKAWEVLSFFATDMGGRDFNFIHSNETNELMAHWLDSKNLIEHGTSIAGSWLTEDGRQVYDAIKALT